MVESGTLIKDLSETRGVGADRFWVRSLRLGPSGTQTAVIEAPSSLLPRNMEPVHFRTGLTIVRARPLARLVRCFACHQLGHLAVACPTAKKGGGETCRRCGATDHVIASCKYPARCIVCSAAGIKGPKAAHVTASLACPAVRRKPVAGGGGREHQEPGNAPKGFTNKP